ncbi:hypothetical protein [Mesorhizobium sp. IMUNJ 23232]|uniref:hypothetical protein n=1 Tax=Mesorhizobium sp. IMUNJ 23232 TaxID=3376064 RepID=UPI0037B37938
MKIFDGGAQVGEYERDYPGFGKSTFEPFPIGDSWYALYSKNYTATRIMSLPDCRDIGGEEPASHGFCPVELYVPIYKKVTWRIRETGEEKEDWWFEESLEKDGEPRNSDWRELISVSQWQSLSTGFVAGCVWGDDNTWKVQVFDLSSAAEGVIERSERFGHVELVERMSLREALRFDRFMPHWELRATLIRRERRDVASGALIDPYDE